MRDRCWIYFIQQKQLQNFFQIRESNKNKNYSLFANNYKAAQNIKNNCFRH